MMKLPRVVSDGTVYEKACSDGPAGLSNSGQTLVRATGLMPSAIETPPLERLHVLAIEFDESLLAEWLRRSQLARAKRRRRPIRCRQV